MAGVKRGRVGVQGGLGRASVLQKVTTIVFDGNQKVHGKLTCGVDRIPKHTGPKRKNGSSKPYENGHMFAVSPDGYIRGILAMYDPEDTDVVIDLMQLIIGFYENWEQVGMDRVCKVQSSMPP